MLSDLHTRYPQLVSRDDIRAFRNEYRKVILKSKRQANSSFIDSAKNKQLASWNVIKSYNGSKKSDTSEILSANDFNEYFVNVASDIISSLPDNSSCSLSLNPPCAQISATAVDEFGFHALSFNELRSIIDSLKNSTTKDTYSLNVRLIKQIKNLIIIPLCKLINYCLSDSIFPDCLKVARVVPVHKKGSYDDISNYRPISIIPLFGKIYEIALKRQMSSHLEVFDLLDDAQFGFRRQRSTSLAVGSLVGRVQDSFENRMYARASFYDLTKAFDCVSHDRLLLKLGALNFSPKSIDLL